MLAMCWAVWLLVCHLADSLQAQPQMYGALTANPSTLEACLFSGDKFKIKGLAGSPGAHNQY